MGSHKKLIRRVFIGLLAVALLLTAGCSLSKKEPNQSSSESLPSSTLTAPPAETTNKPTQIPAVTKEMPNGAIVNENLYEWLVDEYYNPRTIQVTDDISVLHSYSLENTTIIETKDGIIVVDPGQKMGVAQNKEKATRQFTDKPVIALIYSHSHYVYGAGAFVPEPSDEIKVIAHPALHENTLNTAVELAPAFSRNGTTQFGVALGKEGADASTMADIWDDLSEQYIPPNVLVEDGQELIIDNVKIQFFYDEGDSPDSMFMWLPDYQTVITNNLWQMFPNFYTLRGQRHRDPMNFLGGVKKIIELDPENIIPMHGNPILTKEKCRIIAAEYRDGISYIYQQTIRGINKGLRPEDIVDSIVIPDYFYENPYLIQAYGDYPSQIRGIYRGEIGWFSQDAADIDPVSISLRSSKIIEGFGGVDKVLESCSLAFENKEYPWAAELTTHVLDIDPENSDARRIKADSLRQLGYMTPSLLNRGYYITQALELEGNFDLKEMLPTGLGGKEALSSLSMDHILRRILVCIDPEKAMDVNTVLAIRITDDGTEYTLAVRKAAGDYDAKSPETYDISIELTKEYLLQLIYGEVTIKDAVKGGAVNLIGEESRLEELLNCFEI